MTLYDLSIQHTGPDNDHKLNWCTRIRIFAYALLLYSEDCFDKVKVFSFESDKMGNACSCFKYSPDEGMKAFSITEMVKIPLLT